MRVLVAATVAALALPVTAAGGTVFLLDGRGWGHGVGMSQWGAEGYARHGYSYSAILAHYYPHTQLAAGPSPWVRVLLLRAQRSVRIGSAAPFVVIDAVGRKLHLRAGSIVLSRRFFRRHRALRQPLRFREGAQPLQVNFAGYRGDVVVRTKPGGLQVVNILPLDRYLRGVVPSEVPRGWHEATYEAQAVAARSYTLATLHPGSEYDLLPDQRSQVYGGIRAERDETNLALGATAGQVLTWGGQIIPAFYFSSSGGRTSSVHDAWPRSSQVPYLVSVPDPYDYISPHHVWPTTVLTATSLARRLHVAAVEDAVVVRNSSGRASALHVLMRSHWRSFRGGAVRRLLGLGSTDFDLRAMTLDAPTAPALYGTHVRVTGWVRGLGRARLQELTGAGWTTVAHLRTDARGRFALAVRAVRGTQLRLAYNGLAGDAVALRVTPRVSLHADGTRLHVVVSPRLPLRVERLTRSAWRPVARATGVFDRALRPGSYRVAVAGDGVYGAAISAPVGLRGAPPGR